MKAISADNSGRIGALSVPIVPLGVAKYRSDHPPLGTVSTERHEQCGTIEVTNAQSADATRSFETASGYLHGVHYQNRYERPLDSPPDPAAESSILGFCRDGWPYPAVDPVPDPTPAATYRP